jgi:predicted transcriptional regulator
MTPLPLATQPVAGGLTVDYTENLNRVVEEMDEKGAREVMVMRNGLLVGVLKRETLMGLARGR